MISNGISTAAMTRSHECPVQYRPTESAARNREVTAIGKQDGGCCALTAGVLTFTCTL